MNLKVISLVGFMATGVASFAATPEPTHWYAFDGSLASSGAAPLQINPTTALESYYTPSRNGQAYLTIKNDMPSGSGLGRNRIPAGKGLSLGASYTIAASLRSSSRKGKVNPLFSIGSRTSGELVLAANGADAVQLGEVSKAGVYTPLLDATVEKATKRFHHYALAVDGDTVTLYVDGVVAGESVTKSVTPDGSFCWGSITGGRPSGIEASSGIAFDDWRVYDAALAADAIATLAGEFPVWPTSDTVAKIGTTEYTSLKAAIQAAQANDVVELVADTTEVMGVTVPKSCTIRSTPGERHTLTMDGLKGVGFKIASSSPASVTFENIVITASADRNASSTMGTGDYSFVCTGSNASFTFGAGCVVRDLGAGENNTRLQVQFRPESSSSMTILDGAVIEHIVAYNHVFMINASTVMMSGGRVSECYTSNKDGRGAPFVVWSNASGTFSGGVIERCASAGTDQAAVYMYNATTAKLTLSGTKFLNNACHDLWVDGSANLKIVGTPESGMRVHAVQAPSEGAAFGTVESHADGVVGAISYTGDSSWGAKAEGGKLVWQKGACIVEGTVYNSFYEAVTAAPADATVTLLHDCENSTSLTIDKPLRLAGVDGVRSIIATTSSTSKLTIGAKVVLDGVKVTSKVTRTTEAVAVADNAELVLENGAAIADITCTSDTVVKLGASAHARSALTIKSGSALRNLVANVAPIAASPKWTILDLDGGAVENCGSVNETASNGSGTAALLFSTQGGILRVRNGGSIRNCWSARQEPTSSLFMARKGSLTFEIEEGEVSGNLTGALIAPADSAGNQVLRIGASAVLRDNILRYGDVFANRDRGPAMVFVDAAYAGAPIGMTFSYAPDGDYPIRFAGQAKNPAKIAFADPAQAAYRRVSGDRVFYAAGDAELPSFSWMLSNAVGTDDLAEVTTKIAGSLGTDRVSSIVMLDDVSLREPFTFNKQQLFQIFDGNGHQLTATGEGKKLFVNMRADSKILLRNVYLRETDELKALVAAGNVVLDDSAHFIKAGLILIFK